MLNDCILVHYSTSVIAEAPFEVRSRNIVYSRSGLLIFGFFVIFGSRSEFKLQNRPENKVPRVDLPWVSIVEFDGTCTRYWWSFVLAD